MSDYYFLLYTSLILFFVSFFVSYFAYFSRSVFWKKVEKIRWDNSLVIFQNKPKNIPIKDFCLNYKINSFNTYFSYALSVAILICYLVWLFIFSDNFIYFFDIYISFNVAFIVVFFSFIFLGIFFTLKFKKIKKEFMKYSLRILDKEKFLTLFKLRFSQCVGSNIRNKILCKIFKNISDVANDKNSLEGKELVKFVVKNKRIIEILLPFIQAQVPMNNLNFEFKPLPYNTSFYSSPMYVTINFELIDNKNILSPIEFASIFFGYFDSFELSE